MVALRNALSHFGVWALVVLGVPSVQSASDHRIDALASMMREVTGSLDKFNTLYISKLERELSATAAKLAALEATMRTVTDRALAWDNIQNHMTVWTDQSRTMERKLDMLNRCHEKQQAWEAKLSAVDALNHKLTALDKKINTMTRLEFKVEKVSEKLEEVDSKIEFLKQRVTSSPLQIDQPGLAQLAGRGLVSSLASIEAKLDNITKSVHRSPDDKSPTGKEFKSFSHRGKYHWTKTGSADTKPRILVRDSTSGPECVLSQHDSQSLADVNAKVDLLFDKITDPDYDYDSFVSHIKRSTSPISNTYPSPKNEIELESNTEHIFARFWKSIFSPIKKMNRKFRSFTTQLQSIERTCNGSNSIDLSAVDFGEVVESKLDGLDAILRDEMEETRLAVSDQASRLEQLAQTVMNSLYATEKMKSDIGHQFDAHRAMMESRFQEVKSLVLNSCSQKGIPNIPVVASTTKQPAVVGPRKTDNGNAVETHTSSPSKRPASSRIIAPVGYPHCLPQNSPLLEFPEFANNLPLCPKGFRENQGRRYAYRISHSGQSKISSTYYKPSKNNDYPAYRKRTKKDLVTNLDPETSYQPIRRQNVDCSDLADDKSGFYFLANGTDIPVEDVPYFERVCDQTTDGGGWTVIQRRGTHGPPFMNFTQIWDDYKRGFGDPQREFWWGNDFIHRLTNEEPYTIRFDLWDFEDNYAFAEYYFFKIAGDDDNYRLSVSGYRGNASDSFSAHDGYPFSTIDRDNDEAPECCPCVPAYGGGWWFFSCFESNLNGDYQTSPTDNDYFRGLIWELWLGDYSLKKTEMKIRPTRINPDWELPTPYPGPFPTDHIEPEEP